VREKDRLVGGLRDERKSEKGRTWIREEQQTVERETEQRR
jgi:hypothetical protein